MKKILVSAICSVALLFGTACAQGPVTLKFNMVNGDKFSYGTDMTLNINQEIMGQSVKVYTQIGMYYNFGVLGDSAGWKKMSASFTRVVMHVDANGQGINMDTDSAGTSTTDPTGQMAKVFGAMKGQQFFFTMNSKGEVGKITGVDELVKKMSDAAGSDGPTAKQMMAQAFSEDNFKENIQHSFSFYPGKPVQPGESWTKTVTSTNNGIPMKAVNTYTLQSVTGNVATVKISSKLTTPEGATLQGMQINMTGDINGANDFDLATGMPLNGRSTMKADMKIKAQGQEIPMKMDIQTSTTGKKL